MFNQIGSCSLLNRLIKVLSYVEKTETKDEIIDNHKPSSDVGSKY